MRTPRQSSMMKVTVIMTMLLMLTMTTARVSGRRMKMVEGQAMTSVSVGQGGVWAVDENNIYYRNNTYGTDGDKGSDWITVEGELKQVDVGNNVMWGVNRLDHIFIRTGINADNPQGTDWTRIAGALKHVSVSPAGHVWGVNTHDWVYIRVGASNTNHAGTVWKRIAGSLKQVSVGVSGVWGVNSANQVFYRDNTYGDYDPEGTIWIHVPDMPMTYVSSAFGNVFGISDGKLYIRKGMSFANPTGTEWKQIMKRDKDLQVVDSLHGYIWATKSEQDVWHGFEPVKL